MLPSLHPGQGGNPALNFSDIDNRMRMVVLPGCYRLDIIRRMDHHIENTFEFIERKKDAIMMNGKKTIILFVLLILSMLSKAQDGTKKVEMADLMRSNGRIYVVVAVMLTILIGLVLYVVRLDRKISKLEKE